MMAACSGMHNEGPMGGFQHSDEYMEPCKAKEDAWGAAQQAQRRACAAIARAAVKWLRRQELLSAERRVAVPGPFNARQVYDDLYTVLLQRPFPGVHMGAALGYGGQGVVRRVPNPFRGLPMEQKEVARKYVVITAKDILDGNLGTLVNELALAALTAAGYIPRQQANGVVACPRDIYTMPTSDCKEALRGCMLKDEWHMFSEEKWAELEGQPGLLLLLDSQVMAGSMQDFINDVLHRPELVRDLPLKEHLLNSGVGSHVMNMEHALELLIKATEGMHAFQWRWQLLHGDIKPHNWLVSWTSVGNPKYGRTIRRVVVSDTGGATKQRQHPDSLVLHSNGASLGTENFMGEERLRNWKDGYQGLSSEDETQSMVANHVAALLGCSSTQVQQLMRCVSFWLRLLPDRAMAQQLLHFNKFLRQQEEDTRIIGDRWWKWVQGMRAYGPAGEAFISTLGVLATARLSYIRAGRGKPWRKSTYSMQDMLTQLQEVHTTFLQQVTDQNSRFVLIRCGGTDPLKPRLKIVLRLMDEAVQTTSDLKGLIRYHPDAFNWLAEHYLEEWPEWLSGKALIRLQRWHTGRIAQWNEVLAVINAQAAAAAVSAVECNDSAKDEDSAASPASVAGTLVRSGDDTSVLAASDVYSDQPGPGSNAQCEAKLAGSGVDSAAAAAAAMSDGSSGTQGPDSAHSGNIFCEIPNSLLSLSYNLAARDGNTDTESTLLQQTRDCGVQVTVVAAGLLPALPSLAGLLPHAVGAQVPAGAAPATYTDATSIAIIDVGISSDGWLAKQLPRSTSSSRAESVAAAGSPALQPWLPSACSTISSTQVAASADTFACPGKQDPYVGAHTEASGISYTDDALYHLPEGMWDDVPDTAVVDQTKERVPVSESPAKLLLLQPVTCNVMSSPQAAGIPVGNSSEVDDAEMAGLLPDGLFDDYDIAIDCARQQRLDSSNDCARLCSSSGGIFCLGAYESVSTSASSDVQLNAAEATAVASNCEPSELLQHAGATLLLGQDMLAAPRLAELDHTTSLHAAGCDLAQGVMAATAAYEQAAISIVNARLPRRAHSMCGDFSMPEARVPIARAASAPNLGLMLCLPGCTRNDTHCVDAHSPATELGHTAGLLATDSSPAEEPQSRYMAMGMKPNMQHLLRRAYSTPSLDSCGPFAVIRRAASLDKLDARGLASGYTCGSSSSMAAEQHKPQLEAAAGPSGDAHAQEPSVAKPNGVLAYVKELIKGVICKTKKGFRKVYKGAQDALSQLGRFGTQASAEVKALMVSSPRLR